MKELTDRQLEVLGFIRRHMDALGYAPSVREISQEFGIALNAVAEHLKALERKKAIVRVSGIARSIVVQDR